MTEFDMSAPTGQGDRSNFMSCFVLPPETVQLMKPALQVGILSGVSGLFVGTFTSILRSHKHPVISAITSGITWASMGSTFWASKDAVIHVRGGDTIPAKERVLASGLAGGASGLVGGFLNGRVRVVPYAFLFAVLGAGGQSLQLSYTYLANRKTMVPANTKGEKKDWWESWWSPVTVLSDSQYENMLTEKMTKMDLEIQSINDSIQQLRNEEKRMATEKAAMDNAKDRTAKTRG